FRFFFFSSRRRHTRFSRDWSSDVCSSDLHFRMPGSRKEPCFLWNDRRLLATPPVRPMTCSLGPRVWSRLEHASVRSRRFTFARRSEEHTSELQSRENLVCRLLLEKKKTTV